MSYRSCMIALLVLCACGRTEQQDKDSATTAGAATTATAAFDSPNYRRPTSGDSAKFKSSAEDSTRVVSDLKRATDSASSSTVLVATDANADIENALSHIRWAWDNHGPCTRFFLCLLYIDDVGISFSNGDFGPRVGIWRGDKSAHDCIAEAKNNLAAGRRGVAVQWVMASQIHNPPVKDWLKSHPDAVVAALQRI